MAMASSAAPSDSDGWTRKIPTKLPTRTACGLQRESRCALFVLAERDGASRKSWPAESPDEVLDEREEEPLELSRRRPFLRFLFLERRSPLDLRLRRCGRRTLAWRRRALNSSSSLSGGTSSSQAPCSSVSLFAVRML